MPSIKYEFDFETYTYARSWAWTLPHDGFSNPNTYWRLATNVRGQPYGAIRCTSHVLSGVPSENGISGNFRAVFIPSISPSFTITSAIVEWNATGLVTLRSENMNPGASRILEQDPRQGAIGLCLPEFLDIESAPLMDWLAYSGEPASLGPHTYSQYDGANNWEGTSGFTRAVRYNFQGMGIYDGTYANGIELTRFHGGGDPTVPLFVAAGFLEPLRTVQPATAMPDFRFWDWCVASGQLSLTLSYS